MSRPKTKELFDRVSKIVPGGVHSNIRYMEPYPYIFAKGKGSKLIDVDGNEYMDIVLNQGALILGHGDPVVANAVRKELETGISCGVESETNVKLAEMMNEIVPCSEMVKFSLSGTEAVAHGLNIVRGYTKKDMIVKMEGGYNGWSDTVHISVHPDPDKAGPEDAPYKIYPTRGIPENAKENTIIIPFNNAEIAEKTIKKHKDRIAALIVEPVVFNSGAIMPKPGYLKQLREITEKNDIILFFDEVITGFRLSPGGGQEYYGVKPDIATFAKALANGLPISAVAGKKEIMDVCTPGKSVAYGGVYNGSQVCVAAAVATLNQLRKGDIQKGLNESTAYLSRRFLEVAEDKNVKAQLIGLGGQFCIYFTDNEIVDYRSAARSDKKRSQKFHRNLLEKEVYTYDGFLFHNGICAAHNRQDLDAIITAMEKSL